LNIIRYTIDSTGLYVGGGRREGQEREEGGEREGEERGREEGGKGEGEEECNKWPVGRGGKEGRGRGEEGGAL
jgi:hypothetical protein